jgi:glutathione S-transferase
MAPHAASEDVSVTAPESNTSDINSMKTLKSDLDRMEIEVVKPVEAERLVQKQKLRLWMMRAGTYIRRVTILLREKGIIDEFDIIWVQPGVTGMRDPEGKPKGQIPILELRRPSADGLVPGQYLYHSTGILNYIEKRWPDRDPAHSETQALEHHALVCDRMTFADEAILLVSLYSYNASKFFHLRPQDPAMARIYWKRAHETFCTLENMADPEGPYLIPGSGHRPTMVDCAVFANIQNFRAIYDTDILPGHPRLQKMYAAFEQRPSAEYNEILPVGWYEQTRTMNPKGSEIEWQKFEIPVETENKAHAETHVMKAPY